MRVSNLSDRELLAEEYAALCEAKKHGKIIREFIQAEVKRQVAEQVFDTLTNQLRKEKGRGEL